MKKTKSLTKPRSPRRKAVPISTYFFLGRIDNVDLKLDIADLRIDHDLILSAIADRVAITLVTSLPFDSILPVIKDAFARCAKALSRKPSGFRLDSWVEIKEIAHTNAVTGFFREPTKGRR